MVEDKKSSWEYQKGRYKQLNIKFDMSNPEDALLYHYIANVTRNSTALIKKLIYEEMVGSAYEEV